MKGYNPRLETGCLYEALKRVQTEQEVSGELADCVPEKCKGREAILVFCLFVAVLKKSLLEL